MNKRKLNVTNGQGNMSVSKGSKSNMNDIISITILCLVAGFNEKYAIEPIERIARIIRIFSIGSDVITPAKRSPPHGIGIINPGKKINKYDTMESVFNIGSEGSVQRLGLAEGRPNLKHFRIDCNQAFGKHTVGRSRGKKDYYCS